MSLKSLFTGLVLAVSALFAVIYCSLNSYLLAILALWIGLLWLTTSQRLRIYPGTLFFLAFVGLAVLAAFSDVPVPLPLLALCGNLAAWDLSRFLARLAAENGQNAHPEFEAQHVRLLFITVGLGFLLALLPLFFHLSLPFALIWGIGLLTLLLVQWSVRSYRLDHTAG